MITPLVLYMFWMSRGQPDEEALDDVKDQVMRIVGRGNIRRFDSPDTMPNW